MECIIVIMHHLCTHACLTNLAGFSSPLRRAETLEAVFLVDTRSSLSTGTGGTLVHVCNPTQTRALFTSIIEIVDWKLAVCSS